MRTAAERRQQVGIDARALDRERRGRAAERVDPAAQPAGKHLLQLGQRSHRSLLDAGDGARRRRAQADGDCHRLGIVEQQRRKLPAGAEAIPAGDAGRRLDRVPQRAELLDIAPDRARSDLQPVGELLAGPFAADLQQGEQGEEAGRRLDHRIGSLPPIADRG
jgi:hypothetical protein